MGKILEISTKKLTPINFAAPIGVQAVISLFSDLKKHLPSGAFFAPGWKIEQKPFQEETDGSKLRGYLITLTYKPDEEDKKLIKQLLPPEGGYTGQTLFESLLLSYGIKEGLTGYIVFTLREKAINGLATNFSSEAFRRLMCLSRASMEFYTQLEFTEYWLPNMNTAENKVLFDNLSIAMTRYQSLNPDSKRIFRNQLVTLHVRTLQSQKMLESGKDEKLQKQRQLAYQEARKNGYENSLECFLNPDDPCTRRHVSIQIAELLTYNKIFPSPAPSVKKQLVLFVGEGDGLNMRTIQNAYPQFECFAIEPAADMLVGARMLLEHDRIFEMTLQEFVMLLPDEMKKCFNTVLVFNFNVCSQTDVFMQALDYCCVEGGQVAVGVSVADAEYISSNIRLIDYIDKVFGKNYKKESIDPRFTQRLYICEGLSMQEHDKVQNEAAQALQTTPLASKINALHEPLKEKLLSELKIKNKPAFDKLTRVYKELQVNNGSDLNDRATNSLGVQLLLKM